jgi:transcriptional regulator with XRE-family HTH domain
VFGEATSEGTAEALGSRVRQLRRERELTLKELGALADLSHPFLSQLERGLARPSLGSVERIARALDVPVGVLWTEPGRRGHAAVIRRDAGPAAELANAAVSVREWRGGSREWPDSHQTAGGDMLVYVARGGVEVELQGEVHSLEEGDTLLFDGALPHRFRRTGGTATRALCVAIGSAR